MLRAPSVAAQTLNPNVAFGVIDDLVLQVLSVKKPRFKVATFCAMTCDVKKNCVRAKSGTITPLFGIIATGQLHQDEERQEERVGFFATNFAPSHSTPSGLEVCPPLAKCLGLTLLS